MNNTMQCDNYSRRAVLEHTDGASGPKGELRGMRNRGASAANYGQQNRCDLTLLVTKGSRGQRPGLRKEIQIIKGLVSYGKEFELDLSVVGSYLEVLGRSLCLSLEA